MILISAIFQGSIELIFNIMVGTNDRQKALFTMEETEEELSQRHFPSKFIKAISIDCTLNEKPQQRSQVGFHWFPFLHEATQYSQSQRFEDPRGSRCIHCWRACFPIYDHRSGKYWLVFNQNYHCHCDSINWSKYAWNNNYRMFSVFIIICSWLKFRAKYSISFLDICTIQILFDSFWQFLFQ